MWYLVVREGHPVGHDLVAVGAVSQEKEDAARQKTLEGALEELLLVERRRLQSCVHTQHITFEYGGHFLKETFGSWLPYTCKDE